MVLNSVVSPVARKCGAMPNEMLASPLFVIHMGMSCDLHGTTGCPFTFSVPQPFWSRSNATQLPSIFEGSSISCRCSACAFVQCNVPCAWSAFVQKVGHLHRGRRRTHSLMNAVAAKFQHGVHRGLLRRRSCARGCRLPFPATQT